MNKTSLIMKAAHDNGLVIPAFNIPYLPMMEPVVKALRDTETLGLITVARLEWIKFESRSLQAIADQYAEVGDRRYTRLHLDHVPVIDEDDLEVNYQLIIKEALKAGYDSIMVDASRLPFVENIRATQKVVEMAHKLGVPVEAELGAVFGHGSGPLPPYEEIFASGEGFTDPGQAKTYVAETGVDWLSVAVGSIHGAISKTERTKKKVNARIHQKTLRRIHEATKIPLVLHGGTGIHSACIRDAIGNGITKLNIATAIRQPYEKHLSTSIKNGQEAVYQAVREIIEIELNITGSAILLEKATALLP